MKNLTWDAYVSRSQSNLKGGAEVPDYFGVLKPLIQEKFKTGNYGAKMHGSLKYDTSGYSDQIGQELKNYVTRTDSKELSNSKDLRNSREFTVQRNSREYRSSREQRNARELRHTISDSESFLREGSSRNSIHDFEIQNTQSEIETEASIPDSPERDWDRRFDRFGGEAYRNDNYRDDYRSDTGRSDTIRSDVRSDSYRGDARSDTLSERMGFVHRVEDDLEQNRSDFNHFNPDVRDVSNTFAEFDGISESVQSRVPPHQMPDVDEMIREFNRISGGIYNKYWPKNDQTLIPRLTPDSKIMSTFKLKKFRKMHKLMNNKSESAVPNVIRFSRKPNGYE